MKLSVSYIAIVSTLCVFLIFGAVARAKCLGEWLGDMLDYENPRVIQHLKEIETKGAGYKVPGITLCSGLEIFVNWVFQQSIHIPSHGQHIYIFKDAFCVCTVKYKR